MHRQRLSERRCKGQRRYGAKRWGNEVVTHRSTHPAQGFGFAGSGPCSFGAFTSRSPQPPDGAVTSDAPGSRRSSPRRDLTSWVQTVLQEGFLSGRAATPGLETPCSTHREIPKALARIPPAPCQPVRCAHLDPLDAGLDAELLHQLAGLGYVVSC